MLARRASISRVCQTANIFHVCAKRRHFTAGHSVSGMPSPRLRGPFLGLVLCRSKYKRDRKALPKRCRGQHFTLARCASISRGGQTTAVFHVCAKRRHFTAGHNVSGMPSPRLRGRFWDLVLIGVGKGQFKNCSCERWRLFISGCACTVKSFCF